jgi:hypothetical protein
MKINKATRRDNKINKRKNGMQVDNKSIFTITDAQKKRDLEIKNKRKAKEDVYDS